MRRQVLFVGLICVAFLVNAQEEKTIDLDEVTIQASSIIRKKDRQLIFPSKDQVRRSMDGLDLTRRMSLPRLWVDPNTKSISMANGNVQLRINGVLASSLEVAALSPEDIKRVEYHDNPGLRYGEGVDIVLDYITIKRTSGGNLGVDLSHQLNTFWMADYIYMVSITEDVRNSLYPALRTDTGIKRHGKTGRKSFIPQMVPSSEHRKESPGGIMRCIGLRRRIITTRRMMIIS